MQLDEREVSVAVVQMKVRRHEALAGAQKEKAAHRFLRAAANLSLQVGDLLAHLNSAPNVSRRSKQAGT